MLNYNYKVAAYITAYEDIEALHKTIAAIQKQSYPILKIFIVDNSKIQLFQKPITKISSLNLTPKI